MKSMGRTTGAQAISVLMAFVLALGMMPSAAFAATGLAAGNAGLMGEGEEQPSSFERDISKSTTITVSGTEGNAYTGAPLDPITMSDSANENSDYFTKSLTRDESGYGSFDYVVEYEDNTNVGTAKYTIIGGRDAGGAEWQMDYTGTLSGTFEIAQGDLSAAAVSLVGGKAGVFYGDGTQVVAPSIKVSLGTTREYVDWEWKDTPVYLPESDYSIVYRDSAGDVVAEPKAVGSYTAEAVASSANVTGTSGKVPFTITDTAIDLSAATFSHVETDEMYNTSIVSGVQDQVYSPVPVEPDFTVKLNGDELVKDADYTVAFSGNDKVGTATVTVTGTGLFTGSASTTFEVKPADITGRGEPDWLGNGCTVALAGQLGQNNTVPYTGAAHDFAVSASFASGRSWDSEGVTDKLVPGRDYDVAYANTTDVWLATNLYSGEDRETLYPADKQPTITVTGKGNYTGTATMTFSITPRADLATAKVSEFPGLSFDGRAHALTANDARYKYVNLHNGGCAYGLANGEGVLYTTTYRDASGNEVAAADVRNAGSYTMVMTGIESGGFTGTKEVAFSIAPAEFSAVNIGAIADQVGWNAENAPVPAMTLTSGEGDNAYEHALTPDDYTISYAGDGLKGKGLVRATITPKGNFTGRARFVTFTVKKKEEAVTPAPGKTDEPATNVTPAPAETGKQNEAVTPAKDDTPHAKDATKATSKKGKKANPMTVSGKKATVKYSKVSKRAQTLKRSAVLTVKKAKGTVTFKKTSGSKWIKVAKNGVVTVKKGAPKGTYTAKVKVTAAGNRSYKGTTKKNVEFAVQVK